jgi:hypothetical protein
MKKLFLQHNINGVIATLLVTPSLYFIGSAVLNECGISGPWSLIEPIFEEPGNKDLGLNINMLIVFGPIASLIISLFQVIRIEIKRTDDHLRAIAFITTKSYHWFIIIAAFLCMGCMFLYFIAENCNCH